MSVVPVSTIGPRSLFDVDKPHEALGALFLSKIIDQSFIEKVINISLYQADFSTSLSSKPTEVTKFIKSFLFNVLKDIKRLNAQIFSYPNSVIISSILTTSSILDLREDVNSRLVTYDNILSHFPKRDIHIEKLLQAVRQNRIQNIAEFREHLDYTLQVIQAYNELQEVKKTLSEWLAFTQDASKTDISIFNLLKQYRDTVANAYNDLSALKILTKTEQVTDYMVLSDQQSLLNIIKSVMTFLKSNYNFFKTGYSLIDENLGGLESSSVYLVTGP